MMAVGKGTGALTYFEDLRVGTRTEVGSHTFTAEEIKAFAREFDPQPFHLDEEAAARSHFGALCASGWHTAAVCLRTSCWNVTGSRPNYASAASRSRGRAHHRVCAISNGRDRSMRATPSRSPRRSWSYAPSRAVPTLDCASHATRAPTSAVNWSIRCSAAPLSSDVNVAWMPHSCRRD